MRYIHRANNPAWARRFTWGFNPRAVAFSGAVVKVFAKSGMHAWVLCSVCTTQRHLWRFPRDAFLLAPHVYRGLKRSQSRIMNPDVYAVFGFCFHQGGFPSVVWGDHIAFREPAGAV